MNQLLSARLALILLALFGIFCRRIASNVSFFFLLFLISFVLYLKFSLFFCVNLKRIYATDLDENAVDGDASDLDNLLAYLSETRLTSVEVDDERRRPFDKRYRLYGGRKDGESEAMMMAPVMRQRIKMPKKINWDSANVQKLLLNGKSNFRRSHNLAS